MKNALVYVDFRATATRFVNIFVFLLFFENWGESSIACAEYSASKVCMFLVACFHLFVRWLALQRSEDLVLDFFLDCGMICLRDFGNEGVQSCSI